MMCLFTPPDFAGYSFQPNHIERAQAEQVWVPGSAPRWFTRPKTVTHPGTNQDQCRVTMLIQSQHVTATLNRQPHYVSLAKAKPCMVGTKQHLNSSSYLTTIHPSDPPQPTNYISFTVSAHRVYAEQCSYNDALYKWTFTYTIALSYCHGMLFMNVLSTVNAAMQEKATLAVYKDTFRCLSDYQLT